MDAVQKYTFFTVSKRWNAEGGYREALTVSLPLVLSTGAWRIQHIVDRIFLAWYSADAVAAALPAGILNFAILSMFIGTAGYTSTFVAQYFGSKQFGHIGPSVWQGMYIACIGSFFHLMLIPFSDGLFRLIGHDQIVQEYETLYFKILCAGAFAPIASAALSGFYAGMSKTKVIMYVNVAVTAVNILLDYLLIFGKWGFPAMGIQGAAVATVTAGFFGTALYMTLILQKYHNIRFKTRSGWRFQKRLFKRLLHYGLPGGIQFFLDMAGFTVFILILGRLGRDSLAATQIAFNINSLAFMPMIGMGTAVSVLVGQNLGRNRADIAERSVHSAFHITFIYMAAWALLYIAVPWIFLLPYKNENDPETFEAIRALTVMLLRFVATYNVFDTMNIIFASALKGAGDTRFIMKMLLFFSVCGLMVPSIVVVEVLDLGIFAAWTVITVYIILLGFAFLARFLTGKWKTMRVIEKNLLHIPPKFPGKPGSEFE